MALGSDLTPEMNYSCEMVMDNPKNYQVWYHRRAIVELSGDSSGEMDLTREVLADDAKNYHAWTYRIWLVERFQLWEG